MEQSLCTLCPRNCLTDRYHNPGSGYCQAGSGVKVARAALHQWEEPCISGERGSGTVFFSHCSLRCVYCQNHEISHGGVGADLTVEQLTDIFLDLQGQGAHNINLVTATHYLLPVIEALRKAKRQGLRIPVVYNTHGYESPVALQQLDGLVDIYLPDFKYWDRELAKRLSQAPDYPEIAARAIQVMFEQVGAPTFSDQDIMQRGLLIRHLILPGQLENTFDILDWIAARLPKTVYISLMAQYTPCYHAHEHSDINRSLSHDEYQRVIDYFWAIGLENGYIQDLEAADQQYIPPFDLTGVKLIK